MKRNSLVVAMALSILFVGCGTPSLERESTDTAAPSPGWSVIDAAALDANQQQQLECANAAREEMARTLMAELKGELEVGGPAGAVTVCRDMAPMIAEHIADEYGVTIGRTSHRLRNPTNVAPQWAEEVVMAAVPRKAVYQGPAGELGVLQPIIMAAPCLACHGPAAGLDQSVTEALAESYPDDEAVGFAEGDLRGWFWVVVPSNPIDTTTAGS